MKRSMLTRFWSKASYWSRQEVDHQRPDGKKSDMISILYLVIAVTWSQASMANGGSFWQISFYVLQIDPFLDSQSNDSFKIKMRIGSSSSQGGLRFHLRVQSEQQEVTSMKVLLDQTFRTRTLLWMDLKALLKLLPLLQEVASLSLLKRCFW